MAVGWFLAGGRGVSIQSVREFERAYNFDRSCFGTRPSRWLQSLPDEWCNGGGPAVDLGCGYGRNALHLARRGFSVLALDLSPSAISELGRRAAGEGLDVTAVCCDIRDYPLPPSRLIVAVTVLSLLDPGDLRPVAERMASALLPGGMLLLEDFTRRDPGSRGRPGASEFAGVIEHYFAPGDVPSLFPGLDRVSLSEFSTTDTSHGACHRHWIVRYVGRKPDHSGCD